MWELIVGPMSALLGVALGSIIQERRDRSRFHREDRLWLRDQQVSLIHEIQELMHNCNQEVWTIASRMINHNKNGGDSYKDLSYPEAERMVILSHRIQILGKRLQDEELFDICREHPQWFKEVIEEAKTQTTPLLRLSPIELAFDHRANEYVLELQAKRKPDDYYRKHKEREQRELFEKYAARETPENELDPALGKPRDA